MQPPEKKRPKYRIVSDGTELGTHLLDADGAEVDLCIKSVKWEIAAGGGDAIVTLELWDLPVDVTGAAEGVEPIAICASEGVVALETAALRRQIESERAHTRELRQEVTRLHREIKQAARTPEGGDTDGR